MLVVKIISDMCDITDVVSRVLINEVKTTMTRATHVIII